MMKLYILKPKFPPKKWEPWYDKAFGFVVRAECETDARIIASKQAGDEGADAWISSKHSSCFELTHEGSAEIIMRDFANA